MNRPYRLILIALMLGLTVQTGCFWRLWTKPKPIEERTFDVYGTLKSITPERVVIETNDKKRQETFALTDASIKGSDFQPGAQVHVYYKVKGDVKEVTMVVEKIK
ncbi:MAG: hypothetical protein EHM23_01075 [Acidobacteria bacterium]|nr:MAG: hypothetical protein EHM23_01075 [Acidobacteriota bacterium]